MAKKTVKIKIPRSKPDKFIQLCERIIAKHEADGKDSPLSDEDVQLLKESINKAKPARDGSIKMREQSESEMEKARLALGINKGQTGETPNTSIFAVTKIKKDLLSKFQGQEEQISEWGFDVVIGSFTPRGRTKKSQ